MDVTFRFYCNGDVVVIVPAYTPQSTSNVCDPANRDDTIPKLTFDPPSYMHWLTDIEATLVLSALNLVVWRM